MPATGGSVWKRGPGRLSGEARGRQRRRNNQHGRGKEREPFRACSELSSSPLSVVRGLGNLSVTSLMRERSGWLGPRAACPDARPSVPCVLSEGHSRGVWLGLCPMWLDLCLLSLRVYSGVPGDRFEHGKTSPFLATIAVGLTYILICCFLGRQPLFAFLLIKPDFCKKGILFLSRY